MVESWVDCAQCTNRYDAYFSACPRCGAANGFTSESRPEKKGIGRKVALGAGIAMALVAVVLLVPALSLVVSQLPEQDIPNISVLPPMGQEPRIVPQDELVQSALAAINKDRETFGVSPVELSSNQAAQIHAEDVFRNKQISHWMSNGEKPYMTYTRYDGTGAVSQNVAIAGFSKAQYEECVNNILYDCERIDPVTTMEELQYEMMYDDKECCDDGHRNNILNQYHTHVSIGIVYDEYYLAFVQNFENNYGLQIEMRGNQAMISGKLMEGDISYVSVQYDPSPDPTIYEQNKKSLSYSAGKLVANVVKPLPLGYYYEKPEGYSLIVADMWDVSKDNDVHIAFDLARAVSDDGVYTISAVASESEDQEIFEAASHAVFVDSESR
jgi:uncharacterized protein YkwD